MHVFVSVGNRARTQTSLIACGQVRGEATNVYVFVAQCLLHPAHGCKHTPGPATQITYFSPTHRPLEKEPSRSSCSNFRTCTVFYLTCKLVQIDAQTNNFVQNLPKISRSRSSEMDGQSAANKEGPCRDASAGGLYGRGRRANNGVAEEAADISLSAPCWQRLCCG